MQPGTRAPTPDSSAFTTPSVSPSVTSRPGHRRNRTRRSGRTPPRGTLSSAPVRPPVGRAVSHVEARTPAEQDEALRTYAAQGYDLVFAHGFEFQGPAERASAQYPKTVFIVTSGARARGRVAPLILRLEEASYLAGMVAGGLTRSNILGFVGGIELPPIKAAYEGWVNGAKAVNPKVRSR